MIEDLVPNTTSRRSDDRRLKNTNKEQRLAELIPKFSETEYKRKQKMKEECLLEINATYFVYYLAITVLGIKHIQGKLFSVIVLLCSKKISYFLLKILKL